MNDVSGNQPSENEGISGDLKSMGNMSGNQLFAGVIWWAMLVVAVIAIPALSFAITLALPIGQTAQLVVFALTCWICTWFGMWLMKKAA